MDKSEIQEKLRAAHKEFIHAILSLDSDSFEYTPPGKWSAGQQLDHIYRSVHAVKIGLRLPLFVLGLVVGKANRPSVSYEELLHKYYRKLSAGGKASGRFIPGNIDASAKGRLVVRVSNAVERIAERTGALSEQQLDRFIMPHPALGKVTVREMLYFTIFHVIHHHQLTLRNLEGREIRTFNR